MSPFQGERREFKSRLPLFFYLWKHNAVAVAESASPLTNSVFEIVFPKFVIHPVKTATETLSVRFINAILKHTNKNLHSKN